MHNKKCSSLINELAGAHMKVGLNVLTMVEYSQGVNQQDQFEREVQPQKLKA